jgi:uncharacterized membrane protein YdbT with pleckstrin-like domain
MIDEESGTHALTCHPSPTVLLIQLIVWLLPISVAYAIGVSLTGGSLISSTGATAGLARVYRLLVVVLALEFIRRYFNDLYIFGEKRITHHKGKISFRYTKISVRYSDVREIRVKQSIMGRILGYGTLKIATASTDDYEIQCKGINAPTKLARFVEDLRKALEEQKSKQEQNQPVDSTATGEVALEESPNESGPP